MSVLINIMCKLWFSKNKCSTKLEHEIIDKIYDWAKIKLRETNVEINHITISPIAGDIFINSNCYDIILKFTNGKEIKCHREILKYIGYFSYIDNFQGNINGITEYVIDYKYEHIHFIINYLYIGKIDECHLLNNFLDLIILCDYLLVSYDISTNTIIDQDNLLLRLCNYFFPYHNSILLKSFNCDNYDEFLDKICKLLSIYEYTGNNDFVLKMKIWFEENIQLFDSKKLISNHIFTTKLCTNKLYNKIIIDNNYMNMFLEISNSENCNEIFTKLFNNRHYNWDLINSLMDKHEISFNTNILNIMPKSIFKKEIYKNMVNDDKIFLIMRHGKYTLLNHLQNVTHKQITLILNLFHGSEASKFLERYLKSMKYNTPFYVKNIANISKDAQFMYIHKFYPIHFTHGQYVGVVTELLDCATKGILIKMNSTNYNTIVNKESKLLITNEYNQYYCKYTFAIKNIFSTMPNRSKLQLSSIIPIEFSENLVYKIILKDNKWNGFSEIRVGMPIFVCNVFY